MFDYLMSKMTWIIAAVILTSSIIGIFTWQRETVDRVELEQLTGHIASFIDETNGVEGKTDIIVSFKEESDSSLHLPSSLNGRAYKINLTTSGVYISQGRDKDWCDFKGKIHLYDPIFLDNTTSLSTISRLDNEFDTLEIESGKDFILENKRVAGGYRLFVFPRDKDSSLEVKTNEIYSQIEDFLSPNLGKEHDLNKTDNLTFNTTTKFTGHYFYLRGYNKSAPKVINFIHFWNPGKIDKEKGYNFTVEELESLDRNNTSLVIKEGRYFTVRNQVITVEKNKTLSCFIYEP